MSRKSLKILLVLVTILSLISTFSFATDTSATDENSAVTTTSEENATSTDENTSADENATTEGTEGEDTSGEDSTDTAQEASTNHDLFASDDTVTITDSETVNGNAFVVANTVTVNGQIGGDLFVIAQTLNIDGGQIYGNVFAMADTITLNGLIYDLYAVCDTLNVSYDGVAYRDLKVTCNTANINGVIGKDVNIEAKKALNIESDCLIYGNLNYSTPNEIELADGLVTGDVNYSALAITSQNGSVIGYFVSLLMILVSVLVVWIVASKLAPKFYGRLTSMSPKKIGISILIGLVTLVVTPLISVLLMMTVIGVPVGFALLAIYMIALALSFAMAVIGISGKLASKAKALAKFNNLFAVIIVTIILWALSLIPYAGPIISLIIVLVGFGMLLTSIINKKEEKVAE